MRDTELTDTKSDFNCFIWQVIFDKRFTNLSSEEMRDTLLEIEQTLLTQEEEDNV